MAEIKQTTKCSYCGTNDSVSVITKQSKFSRSIKVSKCTFCKNKMGLRKFYLVRFKLSYNALWLAEVGDLVSPNFQ